MLCTIFGNPKELVESQLPTYEDVIKCCLHERRCMGLQSGGNKEPPFSAIADVVAKK